MRCRYRNASNTQMCRMYENKCRRKMQKSTVLTKKLPSVKFALQLYILYFFADLALRAGCRSPGLPVWGFGPPRNCYYFHTHRHSGYSQVLTSDIAVLLTIFQLLCNQSGVRIHLPTLMGEADRKNKFMMHCNTRTMK